MPPPTPRKKAGPHETNEAMAVVKSLRRKTLGGFWFVPATVACAYAALAFLLVRVDRHAGDGGVEIGFEGDADAARNLLSTIAGSLITVAGLAFSLTIVVLSLVSSQFSPRASPSLLSDRVNQIVAGSFVGIFAYCLIVLRTVRSDQAGVTGFVPALSVTVSIALALGALALLLLFIHHMGQSIQASRVVARIGHATLRAIDRLHPRLFDATARRRDTPRPRDDEPLQCFARRAGYVLEVRTDDLAKLAGRSNLRVEVVVLPGDFVTEATQLLAAWPRGACDQEMLEALGGTIHIASERNLEKDAAYGVRQLADVALKALSPGIHDPTTAEASIGYLRAALERLAERELEDDIRADDAGTTLVVARSQSFEEYAREAFLEIGRYATDNARVVLLVLDALAAVAVVARRAAADERASVLGDLARAVAAPALRAAATGLDRDLLDRGLERALAATQGVAPATR